MVKLSFLYRSHFLFAEVRNSTHNDQAEVTIVKYSRLSNKLWVWNNHIGWKFAFRKINVWYGINVFGGKYVKNQ